MLEAHWNAGSSLGSSAAALLLQRRASRFGSVDVARLRVIGPENRALHTVISHSAGATAPSASCIGPTLRLALLIQNLLIPPISALLRLVFRQGSTASQASDALPQKWDQRVSREACAKQNTCHFG